MDLRGSADQFASELSDVLNGTVCHGIRITSVVTDPSRAVVGYKITKDDLDLTQGIPLTLGKKPPPAFLGLTFRLGADSTDEYLMVETSVMGVFLDADLADVLFHYDYERGKREVDGYPDAHLQVCADTPVWVQLRERIGRPTRPLDRLHLPVGGTRYRPSVEDVIDFLIFEEITEARDGWQAKLEAGRARFQRNQLRAAVRRDPESAEAQLRAMKRI